MKISKNWKNRKPFFSKSPRFGYLVNNGIVNCFVPVGSFRYNPAYSAQSLTRSMGRAFHPTQQYSGTAEIQNWTCKIKINLITLIYYFKFGHHTIRNLLARTIMSNVEFHRVLISIISSSTVTLAKSHWRRNASRLC